MLEPLLSFVIPGLLAFMLCPVAVHNLVVTVRFLEKGGSDESFYSWTIFSVGIVQMLLFVSIVPIQSVCLLQNRLREYFLRVIESNLNCS